MANRTATILAALFGIAISLSLGAGLWSVRADTRVSLPEEIPPQPIASYKIDVQLKLDGKQHPKHLEGAERLTWFNHSSDTISDLQFHLYLNAFKNQKSAFFKESGGQLRGDEAQPGEWGWIDVNKMELAGGEDLTSKIQFIHPDDDNSDDQTVIRVPLSKPVKPGEKIELDIKFTAQLPRVFARTGYWASFALIGQWFPKIGVWESAGERRRALPGWNCHEFHANSEFYADFGNYDVTMTVPSAYKNKIGATGVMKSERDNQDGTVTYNFVQDNVHDFAWTVDTNYLIVKRRFKADQQVTQSEIDDWSSRLNLPADRIALTDVDVTLMIQSERRDQIDRHFKAAFNAIKYFGLWYGNYPYNTLTIVDPPYNGEGAGGMEYPTFITAGTSWRVGRDQNPEEVIVHEFGHQFWYGLVASNEFEESWLDEGFNTYSTAKVLKTAYGANVVPFGFAGIKWFYFPIEIPHPYEDRILTLQGKFNDPILTSAWKFYDQLSYGLNSYPRTDLTLSALERYLGEDVMARVMREYQRKWRYRHPASQDFFDTVNQVTGQDFAWFFDQFVKGVGDLDYELAGIKSEKQGAKAGLFDKDGRKTEVMASEDNDHEKDKNATYENEVAVRRVGEAWFPVEMLFTLEDRSRISAKPVNTRDGVIEYQLTDSKDGRQWSETWAIKDRWKKFKFTTRSKLVTAEIDPERKVLLDANLTNNCKTDSSGVGGAVRWSSGAMYWVQAIMQTLSFLS
ncbi:MAG: M1 family metallopeptidase [Blastocatellia bacterium]|nr:M1 family metallopeptidase [Blastocatellia bacterium]